MVANAWPAWDTSDIPGLARYVVPETLEDSGLDRVLPFTAGPPGTDRGLSVAQEAYEAIRAMTIRYGYEQVNVDQPGNRQRIRHLRLMRRDCGTCLDFAVLYATVLWRLQVRPYIVLARTAAGTSHAFVVLDHVTPLQDHRGKGCDLPVDGTDLPAALVDGRLLAVDVTRAAQLLGRDGRSAPVSFTQTILQPWHFNDAPRAGAPYRTGVRVCDVLTVRRAATAAARSAGEPVRQPLPVPDEEWTPAIWTRLPPMTPTRRYPSREPDRQRILAARGRVVIYGEQGMGKSTLAYEKALLADDGYGWFLNAADKSTLRSELAQAVMGQATSTTDTEQRDRAPYAEVARRRLEESRAPWVVVLDNANGDPGEILSELPRTVRDNQTLVVTTTNDKWLGVWRDATVVTLEALAPADLAELPAALRTPVGGNPLFYEAALAAYRAGGRVGHESLTGADLVWQLASGVLRRPGGTEEDAGAADLAQVLAWAPPVRLPIEELGQLQADARASTERMAQVGLVSRFSGQRPAVLMHRLVATAARKAGGILLRGPYKGLAAPVALAHSDAGQDLLKLHGDSATFTELEGYLGRDEPAGVDRRTWGLALYGVASAGEIRGRARQSSPLFARAIDLLDPELDRSQLSECWYGRARYVKDHTREAAQLAEAVGWTARAQDLVAYSAEVWDRLKSGLSVDPEHDREALWDRVRYERAAAMRGLIFRKQSDLLPAADERKLLLEAERLLVDSERNRDELLTLLGQDENSPDRDRAKFNIGGLAIRLAKLSRGSDAEEQLGRARQAYGDALRARVRRYGEGLALESIATCANGLGITFYYGALLAADPDAGTERALPRAGTDWTPLPPYARLGMLRTAAEFTWAALRDRTAASDGRFDDENTRKSLDLLDKILCVRRLLPDHPVDEFPSLTLPEADRQLRAVPIEAVTEGAVLAGLVTWDGSAGE